MIDEPTNLNEERKNIAYNTSYSFFGSLVDYFTTFLVGFLLARFLGPTNYGVYSIAVTIWAIFVTVSSLGIGGILQYGTSKYKAQGYNNYLKWIVYHYLLILTISSIILSIVMIILAGPLSIIYKQPSLKNLLIILALGLTVYSLTGNFSRSIFVGYQKLKYTFISKLTFDILRFLQIIVIFLGLGLIGVIGVYPIIYLITASVSIYLAFKIVRPFKTIKEKPNYNEIKELRSYGAYTYINSLMSILYSSFIIIILGVLAPNINYVAYYRGALIAASILNAPGAAISSSFFSTVTKLFIKKEYDKFYSLQRDIVRFSSAITMPLIIGAIAFAKPIITLIYHSSYLGSVYPFIIILSSILITNIFSPFTIVLSATGKQKYTTYSTAASVLTGLLGSAILIPSLASNGAAITYFLVAVVGLSVNLIFARRYIRISLPIMPIIKSFLSAIIMVLVDFGLYQIYKSYIEFIGILIFGVVIYLIIILLIKVITKNDIKFLLNFLKLDKLLFK